MRFPDLPSLEIFLCSVEEAASSLSLVAKQYWHRDAL